jgi:hypothetical protein
MMISRRSFVLGSAVLALGATTSCTEQDGLPGRKQVVSAVDDLIRLAGRDSFQELRIGDGFMAAELLMPDGGVQPYRRFSDGWEAAAYKPKNLLTSPASIPAAELPLDRLDDFVRAAGVELNSIGFRVDHIGRLRITASPVEGDSVGVQPDATGPVPVLDPEVPSDIAAAIAEIVADYGTHAVQVGSFNGFVHVDANVDGADFGSRIVRYPNLAAFASLADPAVFAEDLLFDPSEVDATLAIEHKAGIAAAADVKGTVWDWTYRRPEPGRPPMLSYGIGPSTASTRVWVDAAGKIVAVEDGECDSDTGFCPR